MLAAVLRLAKNILHLLFAHETKHLKNIHFDTKIRSLSKRSFKKKKEKKKKRHRHALFQSTHFHKFH